MFEFHLMRWGDPTNRMRVGWLVYGSGGTCSDPDTLRRCRVYVERCDRLLHESDDKRIVTFENDEIVGLKFFL